MTDRDRFTIGYRALRAVVEDMLSPPPGSDPERLRLALEEVLRMTCRQCSEPLDRQLRREAQEFCYACVDEAPRPERSHEH